MDPDDIDINDLSKYSKMENLSYKKITEDIEGFSRLHVDALAELGNIGAGASSIALSKFMNRDVSMSLPRINLLSNIEIKETEMFNSEQYDKEEVVLVKMSTIMPNRFELLCVIDKDAIDKLLRVIFANHLPRPHLVDYSPIQLSLIKEVASILIIHYNSALNKLLNVDHVITYPILYHGKLMECISKAQHDIDMARADFKFSDSVLGINLDVFTTEEQILFDLTILPSNDSIENFLKSLGVK